MATDTTPNKPAQPAAEAHIIFLNYTHLAIPASLASAILPHIRMVKREYQDGGYYVYTLDKEVPGLELIPADKWAAIQVASCLAGKD